MQTVEEVGMRKRSSGVAADEAKPDATSARRRAGAAGTPRRTCVVCRSTTAKRTLHRIVRSPSGTVAYDPTGKAAGRGAYLCGQPACLDMAVRRRSVQRALKVTDTAAADAAVEALRNRVLSERVALTSRQPRSSDDEEVRSG
ncbi:MAG TPA: YlxR family protein [Mycobacteriales bacterium]|nr:YlxR family protein [Mycobacteriales bacterium]